MSNIHLIGNAHLDPVWLWRWQDGYSEVLATFRSALDRMKEFPEYKFTSACAAYYEWVKDIDPAMFDEIKARVAEGRWCIVGGQYIQPDCNAPSGESFARHGLYSQRFFLDNFGLIAKVGYNVDSFGHCANLPQLLKLCGIDSYAFMRPMKHEKDIPNSLFNWQGIDGSVVRTMRISDSYGVRNTDGVLDRLIETAEREGNDLMLFYGVGNHGGGPTIRLLKQVETAIDSHRGTLRYSTPNEYFDAVSDIDLPTVKGELQHHARGCYSVVSALKTKLRRSETELMSAEKFSVASHMLFGDKYSANELIHAWKNVLFNQFHDIAGGCCIESAVNDALELYDEALSTAAKLSNRALQKIAWSIDTSNGLDLVANKDRDWQLWETEQLGTPVIVYNPLSWNVSAPVKCGILVKSVTDNDGNSVAYQAIRDERTNRSEKYQTMFIADVPALGYRVYRLYGTEEHEAVTGYLLSGNNFIENKYLRVEIDQSSGCIASIFDKTNSKQVFSSIGCSADVIDMAHCDTWAHDIAKFDKKLGSFGNATVTILESGPARSVIRAVSNYMKSTLTQDFILYTDKNRLDIETSVDWQEKLCALKLTFNTDLDDPTVVCDIPYGAVSREANGEEEHFHKWADLSDGSYGIGFINDSKYSYSASGSSFSLTAINNAIYADHFGQEYRDEYCNFTDIGLTRFKYSILPHSGDLKKASVIRNAYEVNYPLSRIVGTFHSGTLPCEMSLINISSESVIAEVLKLSEDGLAYILRCYEINGESADVTISLPYISRCINTVFSSHEIKTFYIPFDSSQEIRETNFLEL